MLNVGDAVLSFLGDTSHLAQVFARIPAAQEAESMGALDDGMTPVNTRIFCVALNALR